MFKWLSNFFGNMNKPNLEKMKVTNLLEARVELLKAQAGYDYAKAMVNYHTTVVNRLVADIQTTMVPSSRSTTESDSAFENTRPRSQESQGKVVKLTQESQS